MLARIQLLLPLSLALTACGGGSATAVSAELVLLESNVTSGAVWHINRPLVLRFNQDVDFASVSLNSVRIRTAGGTPAVGEFRRLVLANGDPDLRSVVFQPRCPRSVDLSDAGLLPGGVQYELHVPSEEVSPGSSVRSSSGAALAQSHRVVFRTPVGTLPQELFIDPRPGAPLPRIRPQGESGEDYTHVQLGGDPTRRLYFERAPGGTVALEGGAELDWNLWSDPHARVALELHFDQAVLPFETNVNAERLPLEYLDGSGVWRALPTEVVLEANCGALGAVVSITPIGVLPPGAQLRGVITTAFTDLVGEAHPLALDAFAPARTRPAPATLADSLEQEFLLSGSEPGSFEDTTLELPEPRAVWGGGQLEAALSFSGNGGVGGDFDWEVPDGETLIFNTTSQAITGGPGFTPTRQQVVEGGVIDVRNLRVGAGAVLAFEGPNPVVILATGKVEVFGQIDVSGFDNRGSQTVWFAQVEPGSPGNAGGGRGGNGSPAVNAHSARGERGSGAFGSGLGGGDGGETGWVQAPGPVSSRRGAGGGGGVLGPDQRLQSVARTRDQSRIGLDAESGFANLSTQSPTPSSAVSPPGPPRGGAAGFSPFTDPDPSNDFFGTLVDDATGALTRGELVDPWAGAGGGGGGDAVYTNGQPFPPTPYYLGGHENGAGGGGGAGSLRILALGDIVFGSGGRIVCRGGDGGGGQNTSFFDRVGGGSGGGSGGHVILETASRIDLSQGSGGAIDATGGQGGPGANNVGGALPGTEPAPLLDACPTGYPTTGPNGCLGHVDGAGGDGGPGIIQMHTPGGLAGGDILLPPFLTLRELCFPEPIHLTAARHLVPTHGPRSTARSTWILLGLGGFDAGALAPPYFKPGTFSFGDVDPVTGLVSTTNEVVRAQAPILGPTKLVLPSQGLPALSASDPYALVMDASPLLGTPGELYLSNPNLMRHFVLELTEVGNASVFERYDVISADLDPVTNALTLRTSTRDPGLDEFDPGGGVAAALIPSFFRVRTDGVLDWLPDDASVRIRFQAAPATEAGTPDLSSPVPGPTLDDWTSDPALLSTSPLSPNLRFLRFEARFDLNVQKSGLSLASPIPAIDFLRFPFRYSKP